MACKYVDNFEFPSEAGFTGSAGKTMVSGYARGGTVKQAVAAFKKADAKQDAKLVAKAVKSVKPMKKGLGGIVKALSPLAAIASGDAPTGMRRGGKVGVPVHNRAPMFGKKC